MDYFVSACNAAAKLERVYQVSYGAEVLKLRPTALFLLYRSPASIPDLPEPCRVGRSGFSRAAVGVSGIISAHERTCSVNTRRGRCWRHAGCRNVKGDCSHVDRGKEN